MTVYMLSDNLIFPHPVLSEPSGLLAVGGDLSVERLLLAYKSGIFPWYSEGDPILWFSPDPRMVLFPNDLYVTKGLKKIIRSGKYDVRFDTCFEDVIKKCSLVPRNGQDGTWITAEMIDGYVELHNQGYAHTVEVFHNGNLVGGLYGVSIGGVFFGESMFHDVTNASKIALYFLVERVKLWGFEFIDSQVPNDHMKSMGCKEIPRPAFLKLLERAMEKETVQGNWGEADIINKPGTL